jgi:hypothetical protein
MLTSERRQACAQRHVDGLCREVPRAGAVRRGRACRRLASGAAARAAPGVRKWERKLRRPVRGPCRRAVGAPAACGGTTTFVAPGAPFAPAVRAPRPRHLE